MINFIRHLLKRCGIFRRSQKSSDGVVIRIKMSNEAYKKIEEIVAMSSRDLQGVVKEALQVSAAAYKYGHQGRDIIVALESDRTLEIYLDGPDGGDGLPTEDDGTIVDFVAEVQKRAA